MNKIYKVIWSKTRNCYVAVSEIAKRNGKSCTSVNCGAKANRRRVALALALSLWIAGGSVASATDPIVITGSNDTQIGVTDDMNLIPNNSGWENYPVMKYNDTGKKREYYSLNPHYSSIPDTLWFQSGQYGDANNDDKVGLYICAVRRGGGLSYPDAANGRSLRIGSSSNTEQPTFTGTDVLFYGGLDRDTTSTADVKNNSVTMDGGSATATSEIQVYGGWAENYTAITGTHQNHDASNNAVTINNFTFNAGSGRLIIDGGNSGVFRNYSGNSAGSANENKVTINGGTFTSNGSLIRVAGGYAGQRGGSANYNSVIITGGNFTSDNHDSSNPNLGTMNPNMIAGGLISTTSPQKGASKNSVSIAGGNFNDKLYIIVGGGFYKALVEDQVDNNGKYDYNTVNLYGTVTGLGNAQLKGSNVKFTQSYPDGSTNENELHIGGTKTYTKSGEEYVPTVEVKTPFVGYKVDGIETTRTNKVGSVNNFSSIVLHKVDWSTTTPVLAAGSFNNTANLDISGMDITSPSSGTMKLLQSDNADLGSMTLTYKNANDETKRAQTIGSTGIPLGTLSISGTDTTTPGVTVTFDKAQAKVTRATDKKSIDYTIAPEYSSATLGEMSWTSGGYSFASDATISSDGLAVNFADNFAVAGAEDKANGSTLDLLDLTATSGTIKDSPSTSVTVSKANQPVTTDNKLKFSWTRSDTVVKNSDGKKLVYTTGATSNVATATFDGEIAWNTENPYYDASGKGYSFNSDTAIDTTNLSFAGTTNANPVNQSMTLIANATGITGNHITQPADGIGTVTVNGYTENGWTFDGKAKGTVSVEESAVKYTINSVGTDTVTLGELAWGTTDRSLPSGWTASGDTTINASGFAYAAEPKATTALVAGDTATILTAQGLSSANDSKISGGTGKTVGIYADSGNGVKLDATATGHVAAAVNALNYVVDSITLNSIVLKDWNGTASDTPPSVPTGWTLKQDGETVIATINTNDVAPAEPIAFGEQRTLLTASDGYFTNIQFTGNKIWQAGGAFEETEASNGVRVSGTQTSGGVKLNEAASAIIYEAGKTNVTGIKLEGITFENNDKARSFNGEYDLTTADITIGSSLFTTDSQSKMEAGDTMTIVDATGAITYAASGQTLKDFDAITNLEVDFSDTITDPTNSSTTIAFAGKHTDTLALNAESTGVKAKTKLIYSVGDKVVDKATLSGPITWSDGGIHYTNGSEVNQNGTKATYKFDENTVVNISGVQFNAAADPLTGSTKSMTLLKDVNDVVPENVSGTPTFTVALDQTNTKLNAKASGTAAVSGNDVTYTVSGVALDKITVKSANGTADKVPANWTMAVGASIETDSMTVPELAAGTHVDILQSDTDGFFANVPINGANVYGKTQYTFTDSDAAKSVTIAGTQDKGVTLNTEKKHLIYKAGTLDVASVTLGPVEWKKGATVFDRSSAGYNYAGVAALGTDGFAVSYASPETVATGDSITLLQANATLKDMAEQTKQTAYSYSPVAGVAVDANITGKLAASGGAVTYTAAENRASKLTFTNVDWKDSGALMARPSNIIFSGADVDTAKISFQNIQELEANKQMTLVSDFGDKVGTITGSKYTVGTGLEGEGAASLSGSDLVFTAKTAAKNMAAQEQTHNTLMAMEAGIALLAAGNEHISQTMDSLAVSGNVGADGLAIGASMGGGRNRYETGSHVNVNSWNAAVAVGAKRELKNGSLEYGVFGEYGKANYKLHSNTGTGDGDSHYAGGGLLAKWTNKHDVYTEASFRMGRMSDDAKNLLYDAMGNGYGYDVHANYLGAHVGVGKIFRYDGGKSLDVYGKYFYTKRDGVDFTAGGSSYRLDSVASSLLRIGARYGTTDKKWNWYGGLAYEYEFDGKSDGTVSTGGVSATIRAASIKGSSVRGEIGMKMNATKTNPWQVDVSLYGYGGKHRGFGGNVNVAYMF